MLKRALGLGSTLLPLLVLAAACGDSDETGTGGSTAATTTTTSVTTTSGGGSDATTTTTTTGGGGEGGAGGDTTSVTTTTGGGGEGGMGEGGAGGSEPVLPADPIIVGISATGHDRAYAVEFDPSGAFFYVSGNVTDGTDAATADHETFVAKFMLDGKLDTTFGTQGIARVNLAIGKTGEVSRGLAIQSTGKIVVSGSVETAGGASSDRDIGLARFDTAGKLDTTFGVAGVRIQSMSLGAQPAATFLAEAPYGMAMAADDSLIIHSSVINPVTLTDRDYALVKFTANGALDTTYGTTAGMTILDIASSDASIRHPLITPDGSAFGFGYFRDNVSAIVSPVAYKLTPAGLFDTTFGAAGVYNQVILQDVVEFYGAALQGNKLVTAGYGKNALAETNDWISLRLTPTGFLDTTWGNNGMVRIDPGGYGDNCRHVVALPDGRIVLIGGGKATAPDTDAMVAQLTPNGQPDDTFDPFGWKLYDLGGTSDMLWDVALAPDGKYMVAVGVQAGAAANNDQSALLFLPID